MNKKKYSIKLLDEGLEFKSTGCESISKTLSKLNQNHKLVGCLGGGCGICKIKILRGNYEIGRMSSKFISNYELGKGYSLACKTYPKSDMEIECIGKS